MSAQLAENLLAVLWLDRCRQVQLLSQGRELAARVEITRTLLIPFVVEQRWGFEPGNIQAAGILNFDSVGVGALGSDHLAEELILNRIIIDIENCAWHPLEGYMRCAEFFCGTPRAASAASLRALLGDRTLAADAWRAER